MAGPIGSDRPERFVRTRAPSSEVSLRLAVEEQVHYLMVLAAPEEIVVIDGVPGWQRLSRRPALTAATLPVAERLSSFGDVSETQSFDSPVSAAPAPRDVGAARQ